ncbi:hypothetical protein [Nocardioides houyundeii]|uniref:hypothetical protein n=1 Tax=Nocardioides houyundeii TaxID=2045452 RepID=UPI000C76FBE2|nr:hypothetical protein [Nocardioides houyundeii]
MANPDVEEIAAELAESGSHLGPGTQGWIDDAQLAAVSAAAEAADLPVHLVLVVPPEHGDLYFGDDLLVRVHDAGGPDGLYIGVNHLGARNHEDGPPNDPTVRGGQLDLALRQWGDVGGSSDLTRDVEHVLSYANGPGEAYPFGEGLVRVVESLAEGTFADLVTAADEGLDVRLAASREEREEGGSGTSTSPATPERDSGDSGSVVTGVVLVLLAVVALAAGVAWVRRRRQTAAPRAFVLPESVLDRVRAAEDAELERRARAEVLALGESIDAAEMSGSGSTAWAAALDHYEAAGRLIPPSGAVDSLAAVGALVLAGRGREALAAARRGRTFSPSRPCFLNPLHGVADGDRTLEHGGGETKAPICRTCRRDLEAGRRPDILDVVVHGRPRHYFETDREPWASTGFGALEVDLVGRVQRGTR